MWIPLLRLALAVVAIGCFYFGLRYARAGFLMKHPIYGDAVFRIALLLFVASGVMIYCLTLI